VFQPIMMVHFKPFATKQQADLLMLMMGVLSCRAIPGFGGLGGVFKRPFQNAPAD
jgi:hypothetical protein